jgi:hypothetical protein
MATFHFIAWATAPDSSVRRLEIEASCQAAAVLLAFRLAPRSVAVSARLAKDRPVARHPG